MQPKLCVIKISFYIEKYTVTSIETTSVKCHPIYIIIALKSELACNLLKCHTSIIYRDQQLSLTISIRHYNPTILEGWLSLLIVCVLKRLKPICLCAWPPGEGLNMHRQYYNSVILPLFQSILINIVFLCYN